jgi:hypothetical protein
VKIYVDSSVVLRVVLGEKGKLSECSRTTQGVTSEITRVECLRALDRLRLDGSMQALRGGGRRPRGPVVGVARHPQTGGQDEKRDPRPL